METRFSEVTRDLAAFIRRVQCTAALRSPPHPYLGLISKWGRVERAHPFSRTPLGGVTPCREGLPCTPFTKAQGRRLPHMRTFEDFFFSFGLVLALLLILLLLLLLFLSLSLSLHPQPLLLSSNVRPWLERQPGASDEPLIYIY